MKKHIFIAFVFGIMINGDCQPIRNHVQPDYAWTKVVWDQDSARYTAVRRQIENQMFNRGEKNNEKKLRMYMNQAFRNPKNALNEYAYAMATYKEAILSNKSDVYKTERMRLAYQILEKIGPSRNAELSRLRFLIQGALQPSAKLMPMGYRLLKVFPRDWRIYNRNARLVAEHRWRDSKEMNRSLTFALTAYRLAPQEKTTLLTIGYIYRIKALQSKSKTGYIKSIKHYKKFAEQTPKGHRYREDALQVSRMLQSEMQTLSSKKMLKP